ncbi:zf-TFIIB domain-containing protein [Nocardiopsis rhodophaea]|uniref:Zf-TFIIB domain-containing protein n=2 Tax=Nocardiopsis rhodophaea TaxID=280238 RepID=A0ABN2S2Z8_9ACTN
MQTFDRMGIHLEQCERCRGIFLDHGELEQIVSAEQRHYGPPPMHQAPTTYADSPRGYRGKPDSPQPYRGGYGHQGYKDSPRPYGYADSPRPYGKKRRKSFFEELFD